MGPIVYARVEKLDVWEGEGLVSSMFAILALQVTDTRAGNSQYTCDARTSRHACPRNEFTILAMLPLQDTVARALNPQYLSYPRFQTRMPAL